MLTPFRPYSSLLQTPSIVSWTPPAPSVPYLYSLHSKWRAACVGHAKRLLWLFACITMCVQNTPFSSTCLDSKVTLQEPDLQVMCGLLYGCPTLTQQTEDFPYALRTRSRPVAGCMTTGRLYLSVDTELRSILLPRRSPSTAQATYSRYTPAA